MFTQRGSRFYGVMACGVQQSGLRYILEGQVSWLCRWLKATINPPRPPSLLCLLCHCFYSAVACLLFMNSFIRGLFTYILQFPSLSTLLSSSSFFLLTYLLVCLPYVLSVYLPIALYEEHRYLKKIQNNHR